MKFVFHVTENHTHAGPTSAWQKRIEAQLATLLSKLEDGMAATKDSIDGLITAFDQATNRVAGKLEEMKAEIQALKDQVAAGSPITQEQLDALEARLTQEVGDLQALGADAENPVPENPPVDGTVG
jgi:hypothetical protein